jgi:membrane protein insertase Oxa1/YidC/SpoIIIJ
MPYYQAIFAATIAMRSMMLPLAIMSQREVAKTAIVQPQVKVLQDWYNNHPHREDRVIMDQFTAQMRAIYSKHKLNPLKSLAMVLAQFPVFLSFFFGLKSMGSYFPGLSNGGIYWFTDLAAADPYYIFPVLNALSFLAMIELGAGFIS